MLEIEINIGSGQMCTLRGGKGGTFELCNTVDMKQPDSEERIPTLVAFKFYNSWAAAIDAILRFRVARSDARTLEELKDVVIREHRKLREMFDGLTPATENVERLHSTKELRKIESERNEKRANKAPEAQDRGKAKAEEEEAPVRRRRPPVTEEEETPPARKRRVPPRRR